MIELRSIAVRQSAFALSGLDMDVPAGSYAVLMGRTGCGKTTLLEVIAGLRRPALGTVRLGGRDVTRLDPADRGVGYVPQDGALFTTMTVGEQIELPLRVRGVARPARRARVAELVDLVGIAHLVERRPAGLSGGERQRVALARAVSARPGVLLLDEPMSALDDETRERIYGVIERVREHERVTALHVTHSRREAVRLGDVHLRLDGGTIVEMAGSEAEAKPAGGGPGMEESIRCG